MKYEKEILEKLAELDISIDILTEEEITQLEEEVEIEKNGGTVIDGVLTNPELFYRNVRPSERNN